MQTVNEEVVNYLKENGFDNVRGFGDQIKFNVNQLSKNQLRVIDDVPADLDVLIKRSGTGLVVILT